MEMKLGVLGSGKKKLAGGIRRLLKFPVLWVMVLATLLLGGCVDYDLGVNFANTNKGEIVQSIKVGEKLTEFGGDTLKEWLHSIETRASALGGRTKKISDREIAVTIPFNNGEEFAEKFNRFFNPTGEQPNETAANIPKINSLMSLHQGNFLVAVRNQLSYDLDLRSIGQLSPDGKIAIDPVSLLELQFRLNTSWGANNVAKGENAIVPTILNDGHQLVWQLQPGAINHIEAVFWLPSPLGIGAVIIALLVGLGIFLKDKVLPGKRAIA